MRHITHCRQVSSSVLSWFVLFAGSLFHLLTFSFGWCYFLAFFSFQLLFYSRAGPKHFSKQVRILISKIVFQNRVTGLPDASKQFLSCYCIFFWEKNRVIRSCLSSSVRLARRPTQQTFKSTPVGTFKCARAQNLTRHLVAYTFLMILGHNKKFRYIFFIFVNFLVDPPLKPPF